MIEILVLSFAVVYAGAAISDAITRASKLISNSIMAGKDD